MPVIKFKNFEALDRFEREGKGISWNFRPDKSYFEKALQFNIRIPNSNPPWFYDSSMTPGGTIQEEC